MIQGYATDVLEALAACVCTALREEGTGDLCWCGPMVAAEGSVAWDMCEECQQNNKCGTGYVSLTRVFPYTSFPNESPYSICDSFFGLELLVGVLRCAPTMDSMGRPPTEVEVAEAAAAVTTDMFALLKGIKCCELPGSPALMVQGWMALGPSGGCQGGQWTVLVGDLEG